MLKKLAMAAMATWMLGCGGGGGGTPDLCAQIVSTLQDCGLASQGVACTAPPTPATPEDICMVNCVTGATCAELDAQYCQMDNTLATQCDLMCYPRFDCGDGSDIRGTWQCDGFQDCANGADEQNCPMFTCGNGDMIIESWHCDAFEDCTDGTDEQNCPAGSNFRCTSGEVIPPTWECDGDNDCMDSSDEHSGCPTWACANGDTIVAKDQCNGVQDCADGSDEEGCAQLTCM